MWDRFGMVSALVLASSAVAGLGACNGTPTPKRLPAIGPSLGETMPPEIVRKGMFCVRRRVEPALARVQLLVDASGSMTGFRKSVPQIVSWVRQSISRLESSTIDLQDFRACQFSVGLGGVAACSVTWPDGVFTPRGDTNLHEAVASASDYDLTFILTDGVAATGSAGTSDCAGGVDAACVARVLAGFVHGTRESARRGLHVVPLAAPYEGVYYTERPTSPDSVDWDRTVERIRADTDVEAIIQNPRLGALGQLEFTYEGPRTLLLLALSREADVGRAAVFELRRSAAPQSVRLAASLKGLNRTVASLAAVEVYPGFLNGVDWKSIQRPTKPSELAGLVGAALVAGREGSAALEVRCGTQAGEGNFHLDGELRDSDASLADAECVDLLQLPMFSFSLRPAANSDLGEARARIPGYRRSSAAEYDDLDLRLRCEQKVSGAAKDVELLWVANARYDTAARELASREQIGGTPMQNETAFAVAAMLSTTDPTAEPHKVFGLIPLLENFMREVSPDQRSVVLGSLEVHRR